MTLHDDAMKRLGRPNVPDLERQIDEMVQQHTKESDEIRAWRRACESYEQNVRDQRSLLNEAEQDIHALIAEVRRLRERQEDDTVLLGTIAGERDAAIAERDRARVGSDRAESAARENADRAKHYYAALTEARRVLREASEWLEPEISRGPANPQWVQMMRNVAAVLAQEEEA